MFIGDTFHQYRPVSQQVLIRFQQVLIQFQQVPFEPVVSTNSFSYRYYIFSTLHLTCYFILVGTILSSRRVLEGTIFCRTVFIVGTIVLVGTILRSSRVLEGTIICRTVFIVGTILLVGTILRSTRVLEGTIIY